MRFRFCGDLDAPDWVLKELAVLAKMSAVRVRLLAGAVATALLADLSASRARALAGGGAGEGDAASESSLDYAKVEKLTGGAELTLSDVKAVVAVLRFLFLSAAKFDCSSEVLNDELQQLGMPKEHGDAVARPFKTNRDKLRAALSGATLRVNRLASLADPAGAAAAGAGAGDAGGADHFAGAIEWRVDLILASSDLDTVMEPLVQLKLHLAGGGADGALAAGDGDGTVAFDVTGDKFRVLLAELKAARQVMDQ